MDFNAIAIATTDLKSGEYRNETKETQETIFSNSFSDNYNDFGVWIRSIFNKEISQTGVNSIIKSIDTAKRNKGIDTEHNKCTYTSRYQANSHRSTTSLNSVQIFDQSYSLREQQCDEITTKPVDIDSTSHPFISKDRSPGQKNFRNVLEGKVMMTECDRLYQSCSHIHISDEGVQHLTTTTKSKVNVAIFLIVQGNVGVSKGILEEAYYMVREYKNVLTKRKEGYLKNRQRKIRRTLVSVEEIEYLVTIWLSCCYALQRQFGQASLTLFHVKEESFDVNCRTRIDYKLSKCLILSKYGYFREALSCLDTIRNDTVLTKGTVCEYVIKSILPWLLLATGKIENAVEYSIVSDFVDCDTNRNIKRKIVESMQFVSYLSRKLMVNTDTTKILDQSMREDVDSQSILGSCIHEDIYKERVDIFFAAVNSVDQNQPKFTIFQSHVVLIFLRDLLQQDIGGCNPLEIPVTSEEFEMAKLYLNIKFKGEKIAVNISNVDQIPTDTFSLSDIILLYTTIYSSIFVLKDFFQTFSHDLEIRKNDKQKSSSIQKKANNQIKYIENEACAIELLLLTVISAFRLIREIQYSNNEILLASIVQIEMELLRNAIYNFGYPYDVITMNIDKFYLHKINNFRLKRKSTKLKVYPFHHLKPDETFSIDDIRKFKNNLEEFSKNDAFYANNSSREEISAFIAKMDQNLCWQVASIVSDNPNTSVVESNEVLEKDARSWPQTFFEHIRRIQCEKLSSIIEEMETTNAVRDEREYFRRISVKKK